MMTSSLPRSSASRTSVLTHSCERSGWWEEGDRHKARGRPRLPRRVRRALVAEGVRLVDEEDAARRALARVGGEVPRLAVVRADQVAPRHLDEVALGEDAERAQHPRDEPRDGCLPRPRVAQEGHVHCRPRAPAAW